MNVCVHGVREAAVLLSTPAALRHAPGARHRPPTARALIGLAALVCVAGASRAADEPSVVDVRPGDSFSSIAARYTGSAAQWRKLYNAQLSNLPDPNRLAAGARLELVTDAGGSRYLRLTGGSKAAAAAPAPAPATLAKAAPAKPAPAPAAAPAPAPAPAQAPVAAATAATATAGLAAAGGATAARDDSTLVIGVLPNIAPDKLLEQYENVKRYLERLNPQKVRIVLPSNFKAFFDSTMRGDYDLAVAAPHFARVAQLDRNLVPLVVYEPRINALLVAPADGAVQNARDLAGKPIAFANPQSLVAMYGQQWLGQQKLEPGKDYDVKSARTDMGVGRMMLSGEAAAAVMSNGEMRALPPEEAARLKVVESFARIPNFIVLAHPRVDRERQARLKGQLKAFISGSEEGAAFAKATGFTGMVDADDTLLRELDPYAAPTRRAMGY